MAEDRGTLRAISWRDICPWLIIFRTFRIAIAPQVLLLAAIGAGLTTVGWRVSDLLFVNGEMKSNQPFMQIVERNNQWPGTELKGRSADVSSMFSPLTLLQQAGQVPVQYHERMSSSFRHFFRASVTFAESAYFLFGALWMLSVWSFAGGAIARIAVMKLGCDERVGFGAAVRHARQKCMSYFCAPLMPTLALLVLVIPLILLGLLMKLDIGVTIAGFLWFLVVIKCLVMTIILLGLLFGWPLMWGTIATEGSDAFDALSRSYNYTCQRPLHYLFYVIVASVLALIGFLVVTLFASVLVELGYWGVSWGAGGERAFEVYGVAEANADADGPLWLGGRVIGITTSIVAAIADGFFFALLWSVSGAIYLLLRRDVDQTEFDEVWVEEDDERLELPELVPTESGVPTVAKPAADAEQTESSDVKKDEGDSSASSSEGSDPPRTTSAEGAADSVDAGKSGNEASAEEDVEDSESDPEKPSS